MIPNFPRLKPPVLDPLPVEMPQVPFPEAQVAPPPMDVQPPAVPDFPRSPSPAPRWTASDEYQQSIRDLTPEPGSGVPGAAKIPLWRRVLAPAVGALGGAALGLQRDPHTGQSLASPRQFEALGGLTERIQLGNYPAQRAAELERVKQAQALAEEEQKRQVSDSQAAWNLARANEADAAAEARRNPVGRYASSSLGIYKTDTGEILHKADPRSNDSMDEQTYKAWLEDGSVDRAKYPASLVGYSNWKADRQVATSREKTKATTSRVWERAFHADVNTILNKVSNVENFFRVSQGADPQNPTAQLSALYAYIRNLDPDSVVREGEVNLGRQAQSLLQDLQQALTRVQQGQVMNPEVIRQMKVETARIHGAWKQWSDSRLQSIRDAATEEGLNLNLIFAGTPSAYQASTRPPEAQAEPPAPPPAPPKPAPAKPRRPLSEIIKR